MIAIKISSHGLRKSTAVCLLLSMLIIVPFFVLVKPTYAPAPWWSPSWNFRKHISISHSITQTDLTNFPILIDITSTDLKNKAKPDGSDIVFTDLSNNTLKSEIELYDNTSGHLVAWIKLPTLSSTADTELYMYYGNPLASNQQNQPSVWDSKFVMVQHLKDSSGTRGDSTSSGNNATIIGKVLKASPGIIDGADLFNSSGYEMVKQGFLPTSAITVEFWFKPTSYSSSIWTKIINTGPSTNRGISGGQSSLASDLWVFGLSWNSGTTSINTGSIVSSYVWNYVAMTWNGTYFYAYLNGLPIKQGAVSGSADWAGKPFYIGSNYFGTEGFKGSIDEMRVSSASRSASWIRASYNIQKNPSAYYSIGGEESSSASPLIFENPSNGATGTKTNPTLSVNVFDPNGLSVTVSFRQKISNSWVTIAVYSNVPSGTYAATSTGMTSLGTTYYWGVFVTDGQFSVNNTYALTTTTKILQQKWMVTGVPAGVSGVLCADVNNDGKDEVIQAGKGGVVCLNGATGSTLWRASDSNIGDHCQPEIIDLNKDGILDVVLPLETPAGLLVLRGNNGSVYWRNQAGLLILHANNGSTYSISQPSLGKETYSGPVCLDVDGNGYPTIFMCSTDTVNGLSGTGRLTSLTYDGQVIRQTFIWRPCSGGLSIAYDNKAGEYALFMGERNMYLNDPAYGDNDYGRGILSFWARNLTLRWCRPEIFCSSQKPMLADVNNDGNLEVITGDLNGGLAVLNATDGSTINMTLGIPNDAPTHYQPSVYDVDGDGHLEMLMADPHNTTSDDIVIWDLVSWKIKARIYIGKCFYGPQLADVNGDGQMEIIGCNFKGVFVIDPRTYHVLDGIVGLTGQVTSGGNTRNIDGISGLSGTLNYAVAQDIDGDGYTELIVSTQSGSVYAFNTPARRPTVRPRTEVQFYSEYRRGAAEYVPPPSGPTPVIYSPNPLNQATNIPITQSQLKFSLTSYINALMNYSVTTNPNIGSAQGINVGNSRYSIPILPLAPSTTYTWTIKATDGTHSANTTYTFTTQSSSPWWNTNWKYVKTITIDHTKVKADLSNFPILVDITDNDLATKAQPNGNDIAFTDSNNIQLSHEIEFYDSTTGHLIAWVNVPYVSSTADTMVYMYYGNPTAPNQQNPIAVWDANYVMVQHLKESSGTRTDSTGHGNNASPYGTVTKALPGKIDGADMFNSNGYEKVQQGALPTSSITLELWFKPTSYSTSVWTKVINTGPSTNRGISGGQSSLASDLWVFGLSCNSGATSFNTGNFKSGNTWNNVVLTWDGTYCYAYLNGLLITQGAMSGIPDWLGKPLFLGSNYLGTEGFNGAIDEVRISNIARPTAWIQTSYNNQQSPSTFCTLGKEQNATTTSLAIYNPSPADKATGIPLSTSELSFSLNSNKGRPMSYTVTTNPYIGSATGTNVGNGRYVVPISNLQYFGIYQWRVSVTDGTGWTYVTFTFRTPLSDIPTQSSPLLTTNGAGNLTCYNQTTYDQDDPSVTNIYHWYRNNTSLTNLQLTFDTNTSTATKDYSGYGNNGTIIRGAKWTPNGEVGGAFSFNKGFIQVPGSSSLDGGGQWSEFTIEEWIYLSAPQSGTRTIARIPSYEIGINSNKLFATVWVVTGNSMLSGCKRLFSNTTLQINTWYHVTLAYKSGVGLTLYINGVKDCSILVSGNVQPSGSNPLYIGWFDYFKGMIDEVNLYPKCLSQQQIYQHYFEGKNGLNSSSTVVSQETHNGDFWRCAITPNDSHQDGNTKSSNTMTITGKTMSINVLTVETAADHNGLLSTPIAPTLNTTLKQKSVCVE